MDRQPVWLWIRKGYLDPIELAPTFYIQLYDYPVRSVHYPDAVFYPHHTVGSAVGQRDHTEY